MEFLEVTSLLFMNRSPMRLARAVNPPMMKKVTASDCSTPNWIESPTSLRLL